MKALVLRVGVHGGVEEGAVWVDEHSDDGSVAFAARNVLGDGGEATDATARPTRRRASDRRAVKSAPSPSSTPSPTRPRDQ